MVTKTASVLLMAVIFTSQQSGFKPSCAPCTCDPDLLFGGTKVDCGNRNLSSLPNSLPSSTTTLLLRHNVIANLTGSMFVMFGRLRYLDLSNNQLETIDENAFRGLNNLSILDLSSNRLPLNSKTYKRNVFKPLSQLSVLRLEDNNKKISDSEYPDSSFSSLIGLSELYMDGLPVNFGPGFATMTKLTTLSLSGTKGFCSLRVLRNGTFAHVYSVKHLDISSCQISRSEPLTFKPLNNIVSIDMSKNENLRFDGFATSTFGLQNSSIEEININAIHPMNNVCSRLKGKHFLYLQNTKLKKFLIDGNGIIYFETQAMQQMPSTLEYISARYNKFQAGLYMMMTTQLVSLKVVDLSGINKNAALPFLKRRSADSIWGNLGEPVPVPPNLEELIVAESSLYGKITPGGVSTNNLRKVIVNKNFFTELEGPITGFEKVEMFDFSENIIERVDEKYFNIQNSIVNITFRNNFLGREIASNKEGAMFRRLQHIRYLDISVNRINLIPRLFFTTLMSIETISVEDNFLENFDVDLSTNINLTVLDLRKNKLPTLPQSFLRDLSDVSIYLKDNPLLCSCGTIPFLQWLKDNKARVADLRDLTCTLTENDERESLVNVDSILVKLTRDCDKDRFAMIISLSVCLSVFLASVCLTLAYRHRWKLRYLHYLARRSYRRHQLVDVGDNDTYQYDVYICNGDEEDDFVVDTMMDKLENTLGLSVCYGDRDFTIGHKADLIINAIENSRKTLLVLSPSFLQNDWCQYAFNMALTVGETQRRDAVVVVLYRVVPLKQLKGPMAVFLRKHGCVEFTEDEYGNVVFWQNLVDKLKMDGARE